MRRFPLLLTVLLLASASAAAVRAQEAGSRAEEQARAQAQKAQALSNYRPAWIERQLLAIEKAGGFAVRRGFFVTFGDIKRGSGIALGPAYGRTLSSGALLLGKAAFSINGYKVGQVSAQSPPLAQGRLRVQGRARWQDAPTVRLYALGPDSPKARTAYAETKTEVSGQAMLRPARYLQFGGGIGFERFDTGLAHNADPARRDIFASMPGAGADPRYVHAHASAAIDSRDGEGYSRHGTLLRATLHDYRQQNNGPYSFDRLDGAAEQYLPVLRGNWVLFLSLRASTTTATAGHDVPFFLMPDLGGHDLRGFSNYRFRDRHSIQVTAEYRWYAQEYLDGAIFYDAGKTVPTRGALDFTGFKSSVGAGIRLHGSQTTAIRLEVARSREGLRLLLAFSPVGQ
jgi:hypothetical protein